MSIDEAFVQLGPAGDFTVYGCLDCGASVTVAELHDARELHLEWHAVQISALNQQTEAMQEIARVLADHDTSLKRLLGLGDA